MKKFFCYTLIFCLQILSLGSCTLYEEIYNINLLYGTWICESINSKTIPTNNNFVFEFGSDRVGLYAFGAPRIGETSPMWFENTNIVYALRGDVLILTFKIANGVAEVMELKIHELTENKLSYNVSLYKVDGVDKSDKNIYTLKKNNALIDDEVLGYWKGNIEGHPYDLIWRFNENGTYDFYHYDPQNKQYMYQNDKPCYYRLYGDFLTCIYSDDVTKPEQGDTYECWQVDMSADANEMKWTGLRINDSLHIINMVRIEDLPY